MSVTIAKRKARGGDLAHLQINLVILYQEKSRLWLLRKDDVVRGRYYRCDCRGCQAGAEIVIWRYVSHPVEAAFFWRLD